MTTTSFQAITVSGNHFQMGYQHGQQVWPLRNHILAAINARFSQLEQDRPNNAFEKLVTNTQQVLQTVDMSTIEMVRGLAAGLELPFDHLLRYNLVAFLRDALITRRSPSGPMAEGCTTWAATGPATGDGQPILAKNRDYRLEHLPLQLVVQAQPAQGYRYTYITSAGSPGVFVAGFNEAGLALADTHVPSPDVGAGLPTYALSMHILEEHRTVRSALDYLQATPRLGRNNLLLADASGDIALFEIGHRHSAIVQSEAGLLINTNHYLSPAMQPYFVETGSEPDNTFQRYELVKTSLHHSYGRIDVSLARQLMAQHSETPGAICRHPRPSSETSTISAAIFLPAQSQILFCHGQPCWDTYHSFSYA